MPYEIIFLLLFSVEILGNINYVDEQKIRVNKCCELNELYVDNSCRHLNEANESAWTPTFTTLDGRINDKIHYKLFINIPF